MALPDKYTLKPSAIPEYFDAILGAEAPERFSYKFIQNLGFTATTDRLLVGILKELGFLDSDAVPTKRYYEFLDRSRSKQVLAEAIREAYADLFAINRNANEMNATEVKNKLITLYSGSKTKQLIGRIATTFEALCEQADFSKGVKKVGGKAPEKVSKEETKPVVPEGQKAKDVGVPAAPGKISLDSLQYHISIVLPESRDQAVYDAIFKSLREHLG